MNYCLLHRHGSAGTNGKASYLKFGTYKTKMDAAKGVVRYQLGSYKIVPSSKVKKTKHKLLYEVMK